MGTIISVILVAVVLLAVAALFLPNRAAIRASLSRYWVLDDLLGPVEKAQPHGRVETVSLEVVSEEGRFRVEVVDDTKTREVVAQRRGRFKLAVSYIPTADYPPSPTFAVAPERSSITDDASLNHREVKEGLERLIREALNKKGLVETDTNAADLYVGYHGVIKEKFGPLGMSRDDEDPNGVAVRRDSDCSSARPDDQSQLATERALVLEFFEARSGELIWRAAAQAALVSGVPYAEKERRTREAIAAMLATYPPPKKRIAPLHGET